MRLHRVIENSDAVVHRIPAATLLRSPSQIFMAESTEKAPAQVSPPDDLLIPAIRAVRTANPTLGATKLLALILSTNPSWAVSEKRLRKLLQREGLGLPSSTSSAGGQGDDIGFPISKINSRLNVGKWTEKVNVVQFGAEKGKGLVATTRIEENELIWKEDPLVACPDW